MAIDAHLQRITGERIPMGMYAQLIGWGPIVE
jgi:hypothetical protein